MRTRFLSPKQIGQSVACEIITTLIYIEELTFGRFKELARLACKNARQTARTRGLKRAPTRRAGEAAKRYVEKYLLEAI